MLATLKIDPDRTKLRFFERGNWKANPMAYWGCQVFGWGGVALLGRIMDALQEVTSHPSLQHQDRRFLLLTCLAGLVASHLLRAIIARGEWLEMPPRKLIFRYVTALAASSLILSLLGTFSFKDLNVGESSLETFTIALMINSSLMGAWMAIYFLLHFYEAYHRARQEQVLLREAATLSQLEALRLQLNPHFLFNALNSIRALIPPDAGEAREGVTRLAGVLRATLGNPAGSTVPLRTELEVVRDYLAIEKLRFGRHLQISDRLDASVEEGTIPPLMLLTIVENAIKHGAQCQEHPSQITIEGHMEGQEMLISVESPGPIRSPADGSAQGIGLKNVRERLQLIYGLDASATLESTDNATTKCTLRYPAKSPRKS